MHPPDVGLLGPLGVEAPETVWDGALYVPGLDLPNAGDDDLAALEF